jgi:hypothetical protein
MSNNLPSAEGYIHNMLRHPGMRRATAIAVGITALFSVGSEVQDSLANENPAPTSVSEMSTTTDLYRTGQPAHGHKSDFGSNGLPRIAKVHKSDFDGNMVPVANEPSGLSIGNMYRGNRVRIAMFSESGKYALALSSSGICGWVERDTIQNPRITKGAEKCKEQFGELKDWKDDVVGMNYCKNSSNERIMCVDGTYSLEVKPGCNRKLYGDNKSNKYDFTNMNYPSGKAGLTNYLGRFSVNTPTNKLHYRYTTPDKKAARIRVDLMNVRRKDGSIGKVQGWVYMDKSSCVRGYPQGGEPKTQQTVGGAKPNKKR